MEKGESMNGLLGRNRPEERERKPLLLPPPPPPPAAWVDIFKTWLPQLLCKKCLREGEWYPLSSLKDDFRASCGMEMDYVSLGYFKLSDFIQSLPGLCRVKTVSIGRALATHIVLLPTELNHHPFVKKGRSYADATGKKWVSAAPMEANPLTPVLPPSTHCVPQVAPPFPQYNPPPPSSFSASGQAHHCFLSFLRGETSFFTPWTQQKPSYRQETQFSTPTFGSTFWESNSQSVQSLCSPPPH